ncbi:CYTH domain-containing protein [uncultured Ferrovibrio sp.]|jgi:adenylate cyclase|uniref:CYTH domain-containing protein n=1 Tax=uncultured Ferrovibrio sp. TaxID=1576913 RepID=UPI002611F290|nr:CYTH domain-containing protein [uncultured Ferrovibrio sp.]
MIGAETTRVGAEIERKFLLRDSSIVAGLTGPALRQGYFGTIDGWTVRLRTATQPGAGQDLAKRNAWLTLKSAQSGRERREIEHPLPFDFAQRMLAALPAERLISKIRYRIPAADGLAWEIDRFLDRHDGLWLVEIELPKADYPLVLPDWIGTEVTDDPRYRNAALAQSPDHGEDAPAELALAVRRLLRDTGQGRAGQGTAEEDGTETPTPLSEHV